MTCGKRSRPSIGCKYILVCQFAFPNIGSPHRFGKNLLTSTLPKLTEISHLACQLRIAEDMNEQLVHLLANEEAY
ncbi:MAG: hypothetical protein ACFB15_24640 [Cyclobacteriaceae bacterium]